MGVILKYAFRGQCFSRTPHTHGGDSDSLEDELTREKYSPYTWG